MEMVTTAPRISRDLMLSKNALLFAFLLDFCKTRKGHFQQHQRGQEDAQLLIFGGHEDADTWKIADIWRGTGEGEGDALTWKMTVPYSSF